MRALIIHKYKGREKIEENMQWVQEDSALLLAVLHTFHILYNEHALASFFLTF